MNKFIDDFFLIRYPQKWIDLIRIFYFSYLFLTFQDPTMLMGYTSLPFEYWRPNGLFTFLDILAPPFNLSILVFVFWKVATFFCMVGFYINFFKYVCLLFTLFFVGYESNFFIFTANYIYISIVSILVTFLHFGRNYTLRNFRAKEKSDWITGLPIILIQLFYVNCWFGSGIQKLRLSGVDWITVSQFKFYNGHILFSDYQFINQFGNFIVLFSELTSPFIFLKRLRYFYLAIFFIFHVVTLYTFDIPVSPWIAGMIFWLKPDELNFFGLKDDRI